MTAISQQAMRGRARYAEITDRLYEARATGKRPVRVWIDKATHDDLMAMLYAVAQFDGVIPRTIAGIPMRRGNTGGYAFVFEFEDDPEAAARVVREALVRIETAH